MPVKDERLPINEDSDFHKKLIEMFKNQEASSFEKTYEEYNKINNKIG